jgi:hypothetical protein
MKSLAITLLAGLSLAVGCAKAKPPVNKVGFVQNKTIFVKGYTFTGTTEPTPVAAKPEPETPRQKLAKGSASLRTVLKLSPNVRIHFYPDGPTRTQWQVVDSGPLCSGGGYGPTVEAAAKDCLVNRSQIALHRQESF